VSTGIIGDDALTTLMITRSDDAAIGVADIRHLSIIQDP
jgi:hypothetical protein